MLKYAKIIDNSTEECEIALGDNINFYQSIGMELLDVEQSDIDFKWYTVQNCPKRTTEEKLNIAKQEKSKEALDKANEYISSGCALYEFTLGKHIEATDGNIAKLTAYMLSFLGDENEQEVLWNTKEDETVSLNKNEVIQIIKGLGGVQSKIWTVDYPNYLDLIQKARNVAEIESINISYNTGE